MVDTTTFEKINLQKINQLATWPWCFANNSVKSLIYQIGIPYF